MKPPMLSAPHGVPSSCSRSVAATPSANVIFPGVANSQERANHGSDGGRNRTNLTGTTGCELGVRNSVRGLHQHSRGSRGRRWPTRPDSARCPRFGRANSFARHTDSAWSSGSPTRRHSSTHVSGSTLIHHTLHRDGRRGSGHSPLAYREPPPRNLIKDPQASPTRRSRPCRPRFGSGEDDARLGQNVLDAGCRRRGRRAYERARNGGRAIQKTPCKTTEFPLTRGAHHRR